MFPPEDAAAILEANAAWRGIPAEGRDADALYARWWAAPRDVAVPDEDPGTPPLPGRLRVAQGGTRSWVPGCRVVALGAAGAVVVTTPRGVRRALTRGDHWAPSRPGRPARVGDMVTGVDRSGGYESDGWWRAGGGGWDLTRATPDVTRIYLAMAPTRILDVARLLPTALDDAGIAWTIKTTAISAALTRRDAAVCYVRDADRLVAFELVKRLLSGSLPQGGRVAFTAPLAPGISWSEDQGDEESFGQVRCRLLHEAFLTSDPPVAAAAAAFAAAQLDPARPHLRRAP